jgi:hypothetical protein
VGFGSKAFWCFVGFRVECLLGLRAFWVLWIFLVLFGFMLGTSYVYCLYAFYKKQDNPDRFTVLAFLVQMSAHQVWPPLGFGFLEQYQPQGFF